jgi:hypothetical protein
MAKAIARASALAAKATDCTEAARFLEEASAGVRRVGESMPRLEHVRSELGKYASRELAELEEELRSACRERGWSIDGQWPNFVVSRGVDVRIDEKSSSATVSGKRLSAASATAILAELQSSVASLFPKDFSPATFLGELESAYDAACRDTELVPVFRLYREYVLLQQKAAFWRDVSRQKFLTVSMDQFRARLALLLDSGPSTTVTGRSIRLLPPLDPKDAVFLYLPAERRFGFVGRVQFTKEA